jgi:transposase
VFAATYRQRAEKGYDGDRFRESLLIRGILPIIPPRSNRKVPEHPDYRRYRDRNRVERMFGKLKQQRRIATRYDKTVLSFESFLNLAAARLGSVQVQLFSGGEQQTNLVGGSAE